ncbi:retinol-binding protein 4 [Arapaima gigas]
MCTKKAQNLALKLYLSLFLRSSGAKTNNMLRILTVLCLMAGCLAQDCLVQNFKVMENFDRLRYAGTWYAVAKKDPMGIFLLDNIVAQFSVGEDGKMTATAKGRVFLFNHWEVCANMFATFEETDNPAKLKMKYWGAASYLETGDDEHWVIDTDYDNYAIHFACRVVDTDGTCLDSYSFIFSRDPNGLQPEHQKIVTQRKQDICLLGKYRRVPHTGFCDS